jgi:hypothetical protein
MNPKSHENPQDQASEHLLELLDRDYSEAMIEIQQGLLKVHRAIIKGKYKEARTTARDIASNAMLIGIWCKKHMGKTPS